MQGADYSLSTPSAAARAAQNVPWLFKKRANRLARFRGLFCQAPKRAIAKRAMPRKTSLVFLKTRLVFLETCHETSLVLKTSLVLGCETSQATSLVLVSGQTSLVWVWHTAADGMPCPKRAKQTSLVLPWHVLAWHVWLWLVFGSHAFLNVPLRHCTVSLCTHSSWICTVPMGSIASARGALWV